MAEVDITRYHFRHKAGMLVLIGTWAKHGVGEFCRCLVLLRDWAYGTDDHRVFVVFEDPDLQNWALDMPGYGDKAWAYAMAGKACEVLEIEDNLVNRHLIITAVNNHMDELVMMPPRPRAEQRAVADITIVEHESGRRVEREIKADV